MFQGAFEFIKRKNLKNIHNSAQIFRVGLISSVWWNCYISLSRDWLSGFALLLTHRTLGAFHLDKKSGILNFGGEKRGFSDR